MQYLSTLAILSLLNGAFASGNGTASDCVLTRMLPTSTVGCSGTLTLMSPHATQQPGDQSQASDVLVSGADLPVTKSLAAKPGQVTPSGSHGDSGSKPIDNGNSGSNSTATGSSDAPTIASGASGLIIRANTEVIIASLLFYFMPILIGGL